MYSTVPTGEIASSCFRLSVRPKSPRRTRPSSPTKTFSSLTSRCTIDSAWRLARQCSSGAATSAAARASENALPSWSSLSSRSPPPQASMTMCTFPSSSNAARNLTVEGTPLRDA